MPDVPKTRYARNGDLHVAYQVVGDGPVDLVLVNGTPAEAGEVVVSSTVKDLAAGSGLTFEDRGEQELKGVPGCWRLFAVAA